MIMKYFCESFDITTSKWTVKIVDGNLFTTVEVSSLSHDGYVRALRDVGYKEVSVEYFDTEKSMGDIKRKIKKLTNDYEEKESRLRILKKNFGMED